MGEMQIRDWFVLAHVNIGWAAATVFLFLYPTSGNFMTWAGVSTTIVGVYHWITMRDQKIPDAC